MTTDLRIRTNGNHIATAKITVTTLDPNEGADPRVATTEMIVSGVGHDGPVENAIYIPHGSTVSVEISERAATREEIAASAKPLDETQSE